MITTADIQELTRPELDEVFEALGQSVQVLRTAPVPDAPPPDVDLSGGLVLAPPASGVHQGRGTAYPAYGYQLGTRERQEKGIGSDLPVPVWEVLVHHSAPLDEPGFSLVLEGGGLPAPLPLEVIGDAEDLGTVRVAWRLLCRAPGARHAV